MAILYKRNHPLKKALAKKQAEEFEQARECPECGGNLKLTEQGKDRNTYWCEKCNATSSFTNGPQRTKTEPRTKKMGAITLRDKSTQRNYTKEKLAPIYQKNEKAPENLETIREAMGDSNIISFEYHAEDGNKSTRNVEPYKISRDSFGNVVLYAYDLEKDGIRVFKLKNVAEINKQPYAYTPRWDVEDKLKDKEDGS